MKVLPTMGSMYSGSLRGITAAHNKGGLYFRGRTIPTNPNTARQTLIRAAFGSANQAWSDTVEETVRQSWRDYAQQVPVTDSLGQTMQLSGQNWFVGLNSLLTQVKNVGFQAGLIANLPANFGAAPAMANTGAPPVDVTRFRLTPNANDDLDVRFILADPASADGVAFMFIGNPVTPGTKFYAGPYQLAMAEEVLADATTVIFGDPNYPSDDLWVADRVLSAADDGVFFPLRFIIIYEDGRRTQELRQLVALEVGTP